MPRSKRTSKMAEASLTGARVTPPCCCCLAPPPPNRGADVATPLRCCPHDAHVCTAPRRRLIRPRTSLPTSPLSCLHPSPTPPYAAVCRGCRGMLAASRRAAVERDEERDDEAAAVVVAAAQQWRSRVLCRTFRSMLLLAGSPPGPASLQSGSLQPEREREGAYGRIHRAAGVLSSMFVWAQWRV